jgi:hypothetical protein
MLAESDNLALRCSEQNETGHEEYKAPSREFARRTGPQPIEGLAQSLPMAL